MSLSLYGVPDGQQKGQGVWPCPSVYSPATALGSLSSVALSSAPAPLTLTQRPCAAAIQPQFITHIWSGFLVEATNVISSGFLREATGCFCTFLNLELSPGLKSLDRIFPTSL